MKGYAGLVKRLVARVVVMLAVLLMPFGMVPASAAARHAMGPGAAMQHCPEQKSAPGSSHKAKGAFAECTMACASALPAADLAQAAPPLLAEMAVTAAVVQALDGLHPDTATPPPKLA